MSTPSPPEQPQSSGNSRSVRESTASVPREDGGNTASFLTGSSQGAEIRIVPLAERLDVREELARGGMGAILKGRDVVLGRDLAVKVLLDSHKDRTEMIERLVEEAQIQGQMQHPGVAPVYELGRFVDDRPYFTMKLVKGQTLSALLAARRAGEPGASATGGNRAPASVSPAQSGPAGANAPGSREFAGSPHVLPRFLTIFEQICQTLAYAHARNVIHRDLKPSNVMAGAYGEIQVMD